MSSKNLAIQTRLCAAHGLYWGQFCVGCAERGSAKVEMARERERTRQIVEAIHKAQEQAVALRRVAR